MAKGAGYYDETHRRPAKSKRGVEETGEESGAAPAQKRRNKPSAVRQIMSGRATVVRTVGGRYDVDDGRYRAKRPRERDDAGDEARRQQRRRAGGTEYDDGG